MSIKNISQHVTKQYDENFEAIFGKPKKNTTGTYRYDEKTGKMFLIDKNIPKIVRDSMEKKTERIRDMGPITIKPKRIKKK